MTQEGYKKAKDISINDELLTVTFKDIPLGDSECVDGNVTANCISLINEWNSNNLEEINVIKSKVTSIKEDQYLSYIYFNDDDTKKLSLSEQILVKINDNFVFKTTTEIKIGDIVTLYVDGNLVDNTINSINIVDEESKFFLFYREPYGLIVAGDMLAYNGCPIHMLTKQI